MLDIKLQKNIYIIFFVISVIMTAVTIYVSVTGTAGTEDSAFKGIWLVFLMAAFVSIQLICLFSMKVSFTLYRAGFYLLHIGLIIFLTGCFVYYLTGDKLTVSVPVDPTMTYNKIKRLSIEKGQSEFVKLDFDMGISDFMVEKYEAADGEVAQDKYYEATLMIVPDGTREVTEIPLIVNKPYRHGGWKIYLMGYDGTTGTTVSLMLKKDPAEFVSLAGLWMIIAGAIIMCLLKKREVGELDA